MAGWLAGAAGLPIPFPNFSKFLLRPVVVDRSSVCLGPADRPVRQSVSVENDSVRLNADSEFDVLLQYQREHLHGKAYREATFVRPPGG